MLKKLLFAAALLMAVPALLQAQFTIPYTFTPNTRAQSAQVNANFALLANALDRRGGTMTGNLTAQAILAAANDTYAIGASGTRFSNVFSVLGNFSGNVTVGSINGFTFNQSVAVDAAPDLVGSNITNLIESNIINGDILARIADDETITGAWTFSKGITVAGDTDVVSGSLALNATNGLQLWSKAGSSFDFALVNPANSNYVMYVPTGTLNIATGGNLSVGGRVDSAPGQPGFFAYRTATSGARTTGSTVDFNAVQYTSGHFSGTTTFTTPVAGKYFISAQLGMLPDSSSAEVGARVEISGVGNFSLGQVPVETIVNNIMVGNSFVVNLDAGTTIEIKVVSTDSTVALLGGAGETWFSVRLVP